MISRIFTQVLSTLAFCLLLTGTLSAQSRSGAISGIIRTSDGKPAAFVSVGIPKSGKGTNTAEDGTYQIRGVEPGTHVLRVSFVGLQSQDQTVTVTAGQTTKTDFALTESAAQLNEVVVTGTTTINRPASASKADIAPLDLPQSIGVVTSTVIADQQAQRLGDVLKNVSGVSLTQQRQGVAETFSARGYSIGVGGGGGSIFKNGLISNTQGFPDASTLESIEVLKGSSALLYGNVSGGLVINMVTKKPRYEWGGEASMRVGSYSFYKPIVDVYGPLSKRLAFRLVGTYENAKSFRDVVKSERVYVNPSLMYKLGDKTDLLVQGDYLKSNITPDNGVGVINQNADVQLPTSAVRSRFINAVWAYNNTDQYSASAVLNHRFNEQFKLNAIAGIMDTRVNGFGLNVPSAITAVATRKLAVGDYARTLGGVKTGERDYNAQLNLTGKFDTGFLGHQLLVGGDFLRIVSESNTFSYRSANGSTAAAYDTINILDRSRRRERTDMPDKSVLARTTSPSYRFGAYVQDLISLSPKFKVLAGVRWSYQNVKQTTIFNEATQVQTSGTLDDKYDKAFSPKGALIYQPLATMSLYASYTNNFTVNAGVDLNGNQLRPSLVDQYEAGFKNELLKGRIFTNLSVYRYRNSSLAQAAILPDGSVSPTARALTGETTSDGMDVDINGNFSKNFYFNTGYGYNFHRYTNTSGKTGSQVEGERLINNPAHTANASIFYTFDLPALRGFKLGASAFYTGQRFGGLNNTVNQAPAYDRLVSLSGFTTIDLSAGYTYRHFSVLAKLSNITDEMNYVVHDRYSINPIPPRQFLTTLGYKF
ncbi:TonB-dependent receptor [Hymenobacter sp. M29]|uniref:TonB-dependent receptor n=1 Tax=Hymenobacter mellowenesis TaxID=3063995 RepID=A0ABT9A877_9BACT|nr:TonB-dependent receptor [Hymenobacter sp. M29]MDO7846042.1 TonB-dependent receptor [Hymenobacter sp. M29]